MYISSFQLLDSLPESLLLDPLLESLLDEVLFFFFAAAAGAAITSVTGAGLGADFRCSRRSAVSPPRPIDVKKLMANRVFLGRSLGNRPSKASCNVGSFILSFSFGRPMYSHNSWNRILMKIRLDDVVSSSVSLI